LNELLKYFIQFFFALVGSAAFAIICNVSRYALVYCGLTGGFGWLVYFAIISLGGNMPVATLGGSLVVAFASSIFSRVAKMPVTVFNIPGIVPLVPGAYAYECIRDLAQGNYFNSAKVGVNVLMSAGAIALGLILAEVFNHNIRNFTERAKREGGSTRLQIFKRPR
jgi:uncharacterized membrane protein YjjB (DUF3815 family)